MNFKELCQQLEAKIQNAYTEGTTLEQAEKLAAEFLYGQLQVSAKLATVDLDARMRKSGVKATRAAVYLDAVATSDKKPTEATLAALIDSNPIVMDEQNKLDNGEVQRAELERYYDIFVNSHIYFRGVARGNFG
jgi:hypothetical protein